MGNRVINYNAGADPNSMFDAPAGSNMTGVRRIVPTQAENPGEHEWLVSEVLELKRLVELLMRKNDIS